MYRAPQIKPLSLYMVLEHGYVKQRHYPSGQCIALAKSVGSNSAGTIFIICLAVVHPMKKMFSMHKQSLPQHGDSQQAHGEWHGLRPGTPARGGQ